MKKLFFILLTSIIFSANVKAEDELITKINAVNKEIKQQQKSIKEIISNVDELGYFDDKKHAVYLPLANAIYELSQTNEQLIELLNIDINYSEKIVESLNVQTEKLNYSNDEIKTLQTNVVELKSELIDLIEKTEGLSTRLESNDSVNRKQSVIIDDTLEQINSQNADLEGLNGGLVSANDNISIINKDIENVSQTLGNNITENRMATEAKIDTVDSHLSKSRAYGSIIVVLILLLSSLTFFILRRTIKLGNTDIQNKILATRSAMQDEGIKLDSKLIELLTTQLKIQHEETKIIPQTTKEPIDHTLAIKVADEIVRMQKNISRMDSKTKGLTPLVKGIERIQNNFAANGYEMIELLNKDYSERMNIDVINFIEDDDLEENKKIVTKIIKPQINFENVLIQRAQVEVSIG
jgi:hypothetical protein